ncbi:extracellular solute-binding protein [Streptomyces turgidiscabies]|uniref:Tat pathway signal sequence domain protein n=1 Tax=Streptomyces turgidiscabies (strain Car8) TaxID=698760 RepID=L7FB92_STRT8|nr:MULTISPECIES: extracellular solute-binding protein [Streptomyces]ELP67925.1 Tat pathway signal sequence domain protein [Streptomyces turgidiscabies Car8]MDX3495020.1 extracellular solute-binding protein [Streptomyces turgidiscabies]GAQ70891.1 bacterial extracellular solute-binding protein [Streptomyces turgidiscabies]
MHAQAAAGTHPSRRRFLALSAAGGAAVGATALNGCALRVDGAATGGGESITMMVKLDDVSTELIQQAQRELGIRITVVQDDITRLIAMLTSGNPPDLVRGVGALDAPFYAARGVAENLDPYFATSTVLRADDLDPANDLWRYDGTTQGKGPRYGMAKDFSQDAMFWFNTAQFDRAGVDHPSETEPTTYEEWLEKAERLVVRKNGQTTVYGGSYNGVNIVILLTNLVAAAGGNLFSDDFTRVDFSTPEARRALAWYMDYARLRVGPSLVQPNPDAWDGPTYVANRMAMSGSGYWLGGMINAEPKIAEVSRLAPAPVFEGGPRISSCQAGTGMWMPRKARNKDAAWRVFEWFFGEGPAKARAAGGWGIPTLKSLRPLMPRKEEYQKRVLAVQEAELKHFSVTPFTPYAKWDALEALINQVMPAAMNGRISVDTLAGRLNSSVNEQLKRGKEQVG